MFCGMSTNTQFSYTIVVLSSIHFLKVLDVRCFVVVVVSLSKTLTQLFVQPKLRVRTEILEFQRIMAEFLEFQRIMVKILKFKRIMVKSCLVNSK